MSRSSRADGQLFVGRLSKSTRNRDLEDIFEPYGRMLRCEIKYGAEMAYAFVDFEDRRDAEDCVKYENGREICGSSIIVEWAKGSPRRPLVSPRQGYDECYRCHRYGHWARDCPDDRYYGYRRPGGGGGGSGRSSSYRRSRSPRRRRSRSRSRSRSRDRRRRSRSRSRSRRSRSRSRSRHRDSKRSLSRSKSRSRSKSLSKSKNCSKSRSRSPSGSRSRSQSKSRSRSKSASPKLVNGEENGDDNDASFD